MFGWLIFSAKIWYHEGLLLYKQGKYDEALACYDQALKRDKSFSRAWNSKGFVLNNQGKYDEALVCYDQALKCDKSFTRAWDNKGTLLDNQGKYDEALACYDQALKCDKNYDCAWNNKGVLLGNQGKYDEALVCYDQALQCNNNLALVWSNKGVLLRNQGKYDEALVCFERALQCDNNLAYAWNGKGLLLLYNQGKDAEALACFERALKCDKNLACAWSHKGLVLYNQGKYDEALVCYDQALKCDKNHAYAWNGKGIILLKQGLSGVALACFEYGLTQDSQEIADKNRLRAFLLQSKGIYFYQKGQRQQALLYFDQAMQIVATSHAPEFNHVCLVTYRAGVFLSLHLALEAQKTFQNVLEINSDYIPAQQGLAKATEMLASSTSTVRPSLLGSQANQHTNLAQTIESYITTNKTEKAIKLIVSDTSKTVDYNKLMKLAVREKNFKIASVIAYREGLSIKDFRSNELLQSQENITMRARNEIARLNQKFCQPNVNKTIATFLALETSAKGQIIYDHKHLKEAYSNMLKHDELKPILEIAMYATQGLHDFAQLPGTSEQNLTLMIDPDKEDVDDIGHIPNAYGVYYNGSNCIYIAGKRINPALTEARDRMLVRGTLIHELTHFVAEEVFKNNCEPYGKDMPHLEYSFNKIANALYNKRHSLPKELERISAVFVDYSSCKWNCELIVRVPQIIAMYDGDIGVELLEQQCPELLEYYRDVFMPACTAHILHLKRKNGLFSNVKVYSDGAILEVANTEQQAPCLVAKHSVLFKREAQNEGASNQNSNSFTKKYTLR